MSEPVSLLPGLYLVATPIGAARDITLRALDILRSADVIAAEDTRTLRKLMTIHGIPVGPRQVLAYHEHSSPQIRAKIAETVAAGGSVAYTSDAGTPLLADPGFQLARDVAASGGQVHAAPGASALLVALSLSQMPTDRFFFAGFLPSKAGARAKDLAALKPIPSTLVFYESPKRLAATLAAMAEAFGPARGIAICRELTKKFEQVVQTTLGDAPGLLETTIPLKGEFVLVLAPPVAEATSEEDIDHALRDALESQSVRDAASEVAEALGLPRKEVYRRALALSR